MTPVDLSAYVQERQMRREAVVRIQLENLTSLRYDHYRSLGFSHNLSRHLATRYYNSMAREFNAHYGRKG